MHDELDAIASSETRALHYNDKFDDPHGLVLTTERFGLHHWCVYWQHDCLPPALFFYRTAASHRNASTTINHTDPSRHSASRPAMGLFNRNKSAITESAGTSSDAPKDIFSHSQSYSEILAEQQRSRKEKVEKQRPKKDGKRNSDEGLEASPGKVKKEGPKKRSRDAPKRRRISGQDVDSLLREAGIGGIVEDESEHEDEHVVIEGPSKRGSPRGKDVADHRSTRSSSKATGSSHRNAEVIDVGDSSGDEVPTNDTKGATLPVPIEEDDESDEELAALARQRRLQRTHSSKVNVGTNSSTPQRGAAESPHTGLPTPPLPDPVVKILVSSCLEQTKPLMVYRKLSQNIRDIRLAWCQRQGFDQAFTDRVFLIHKMRRVYDMTTCHSLGLETDAEGNITMKGAEGKEGVDQVALEAVTDDIYTTMLDEKAKEEAKRRKQWEIDDEGDAEEEAPSAQPPQGERVGLVLKAKGKPDFKLQVKWVSQQLAFSLRLALRTNIRPSDHAIFQNYQRLQEELPCGRRQYHHARFRRRALGAGGSSQQHRDHRPGCRRSPHLVVALACGSAMSHPGETLASSSLAPSFFFFGATACLVQYYTPIVLCSG